MLGVQLSKEAFVARSFEEMQSFVIWEFQLANLVRSLTSLLAWSARLVVDWNIICRFNNHRNGEKQADNSCPANTV